MTSDIYETYEQLMRRLGRHAQLARENQRYQSIMSTMENAVGTVDISSWHKAADLLRVMLKDPKYSEDFEDFPGEYEAAKWFHEHHVFAVRAADRALSQWNPPADVASGFQGLEDQREWHVEMAQYELSSLQRELPDEKESKCFIATAAYGSALAPDVVMLRHFRDERLKPHPVGRWMVKIYERYAPPYAHLIARRRWLRACVRRLIVGPLVAIVRRWYGLEERRVLEMARVP